MLNVCRTCLTSTEHLDFFDVFTELEDRQRTIAELLGSFASIQVSKNDELPKTVCRLCVERLRESLQFRSLILQSDLKLRVYEGERKGSLDKNTNDGSGLRLDTDFSAVQFIKDEPKSVPDADFPDYMEIKPNIDDILSQGQIQPEPEVKEKKMYSCDECDKQYAVRTSLWRHKKKHIAAKRFFCKICNKGFFQQYALNIHNNKHTGEKPFSCDVCGKAFMSPSVLCVHKKTHTGSKPHVCKTCGKGFTLAPALVVHIRTHTGERPFMCEICSNTFLDFSSLQQHFKTHSDVKAIECPICGKRFKIRSNMKCHLKTHSVIERPFGCEECEMRFTRKEALRSHLKKHEKERLNALKEANSQGNSSSEESD